MPRGGAPEEAELGKSPGFLPPGIQGAITGWWLARVRKAKTPNWDIAATATIMGQEGLIFIEAKAHANELSTKGKKEGGHPANDASIARAFAEANAGLNTVLPGWSLSRDASYQLANRFAWSWKLAALGVPVVLVYLGLLGAREISDLGPLPMEPVGWEWLVRSHAEGIVPEAAWGTMPSIGGVPLVPVIRSLALDLE
jgi:hypothetical protein